MNMNQNIRLDAKKLLGFSDSDLTLAQKDKAGNSKVGGVKVGGVKVGGVKIGGVKV